MEQLNIDPIPLFSDFMVLARTPSLQPLTGMDPKLSGKSVALLNGGTWIALWSYWFGRKHLPGVRLFNAGNEAVQFNFMGAHKNGLPCPPASNIEAFAVLAKQAVEMAPIDAILVTCSTMNRCIDKVSEAVAYKSVPVFAIDEPMMRRSVEMDGKILVVATHGPTLKSTEALLHETAERMGRPRPECVFAYSEEAYDQLSKGDVLGHNRILSGVIREAVDKEKPKVAVLAQLSIAVFSFTYPNPEAEFGIPIFNSGDEGFRNLADYLRTI